MKQPFKLFMGGAMAAMALMISACSSNDMEETVQQPNNKAEGIPFTATIRVGKSATTRALTEDGATIVPSWAEGDKVALIHGSINDEMTVSSVTNGVATITGNITGSPADGDAVTIIYPSSAVDATTKDIKADLLTNQDGTLATIAKNYDVRTGTGTLNVGNTAFLRGNVSLENQYAIVKFSLSDGTNAINATQFQVRDVADNVVAAVTPAAGSASTFYAAIPPATTGAFRFKATTATNSYCYTKYGATVTAGKYYQSSLKLALVDMLHTPLTLEATEDGTTVTITDASNVEYSYTVNGGTAVTKSSDDSFTLNAGDIVQFNSTNPALGKTKNSYDPSAINALTIIVDKKSYVYGNVMSMVNDAGDFAADVTLADYAMPRLFSGNYFASNHIAFLADKPLMLPATTISKYCYDGMFSYCIELTALPSGFLPAKEMKEGCYEFMFDKCKGLTSLPDDLLPATTLAKECYRDMFQQCSGLTTLADDFLPATTLAKDCYQAMFHICTGLTHAPILRAPTLVDYCYNSMFSGCDKLSEVTCLATNISATDCLNVWLSSAGSKVSGPKTLYVDPSMTTKGTGSGYDKWNLSDGWTLQNYVAP